jgi:hypothetical protein
MPSRKEIYFCALILETTRQRAPGRVGHGERAWRETIGWSRLRLGNCDKGDLRSKEIASANEFGDA